MFVSLLKNIGYKHNLYLANVNYVCGKTVPESTKIHQIKCKKSKFSEGACPRPPTLSCAKHTDITFSLPPTLSLYHILPPPLTQKPEKTLTFHICYS